MKLETAIEVLDDCEHGALLGISQETKDALKLGIEALNRIQLTRGYRIKSQNALLPGETTE